MYIPDIRAICSKDKSIPPPQMYLLQVPSGEGGSGLSSSDKIAIGSIGIGLPALIVAILGVFVAHRRPRVIAEVLALLQGGRVEEDVRAVAAVGGQSRQASQNVVEPVSAPLPTPSITPNIES